MRDLNAIGGMPYGRPGPRRGGGEGGGGGK